MSIGVSTSAPAPSAGALAAPAEKTAAAAAEDWPLLPDYEPPLTSRLDYIIANAPSLTPSPPPHDHDQQPQQSDGLKRKAEQAKSESEATAAELVEPTFRGGGDDAEDDGDDGDDERLIARMRPDDLYDPTMDDEDEEILQRDHCLLSSHVSDAVLSCPCCLLTVCLDCQRHSERPHQFRAMLVSHCRLRRDKIVRPNNSGSQRQQEEEDRRGSRKGSRSQRRQRRSEGAAAPAESAEAELLYYAVECEGCGTELGVVDEQEVYHFYHVSS